MIKKKEVRLTWFRKLMFLLNLIAIVFLILSYSASYVSPQTIWWLALFGLGYGILLIMNCLFVFFWLLMKDKKFWFSLLVILIGFSKVLSIFEFNFPDENDVKKIKPTPYPVKVMSFNVRLFDLYNWMHNFETRKKIFNFISNESPDLLCLQEYYSSESTDQHFNNNDTLKKELKANYSQIEYSLTLRKKDHWGIATFSRFPIIHKGVVHFRKQGGNLFIFSDIVIGNDTLRVYNTHLESIRFNRKDYQFIENIGSGVEQDEVDRSLNIIRRLKRAFISRSKQVDVLQQHILKSPYPVIVCGDFNDTPTSYAYAVISKGLKDSFHEGGAGSGKTYAGVFPSFRIDYILHDEKLHSTGYKTHHQKLSDHYPISCWIYKE